MAIIKNEQESLVPAAMNESTVKNNNSAMRLPKYKTFQRKLELCICIRNVDEISSTSNQIGHKLYRKRSRREFDDSKSNLRKQMSREYESGSTATFQTTAATTAYSNASDDRRPTIKRAQAGNKMFFPNDEDCGNLEEMKIVPGDQIDGEWSSVKENEANLDDSPMISRYQKSSLLLPPNKIPGYILIPKIEL